MILKRSFLKQANIKEKVTDLIYLQKSTAACKRSKDSNCGCRFKTSNLERFKTQSEYMYIECLQSPLLFLQVIRGLRKYICVFQADTNEPQDPMTQLTLSRVFHLTERYMCMLQMNPIGALGFDNLKFVRKKINSGEREVVVLLQRTLKNYAI